MSHQEQQEHEQEVMLQKYFTPEEIMGLNYVAGRAARQAIANHEKYHHGTQMAKWIRGLAMLVAGTVIGEALAKYVK